MPKQAQEKNLKNVNKRLKNQIESEISSYFEFLSFPSISALPEHAADLKNCSEWLKKELEKLGFSVESVQTEGAPVLLAQSPERNPSAPTLLLYNHYDVQPVDPLEEWSSPPFEPRQEGSTIYARGAQDNKGQCYYTLLGIKLYKELHGKLPPNLKLLIEGEEEVGSPNLGKLIKRYDMRRRLQADAIAVVDSGLIDRETPALTLGVRGIVTIDLEVKCASADLHSGMYGGAALNPIHVLVNILSGLHRPDGSIAIPSFYEQVLPVSDEIRRSILTSIPKESQWGKDIPLNGGERAMHPLVRIGLRPTIEINGISGGYQGDGFKTVIPHTAKAKISCRLVPDQDPKWVGELVCNYLEGQAPVGATVKATLRAGFGTAMRAEADSPVAKAFSDAYQEVYHKPCTYIYSGGSIPITAELASVAGAEAIFVGLGLDSDNIHAPNEHFDLERMEQGALLICRALENFQATSPVIRSLPVDVWRANP